MYFLSKHHAVANMALFNRATNGENAGTDIDLGNLRHDYLNRVGEYFRINLTKAEEISISFDQSDLADVLRDGYMFLGEGLVEEDSFEEDEKKLVTKHIHHALYLIRALNPDLHDLIHLIVSDIVCVKVKNSGGGTASNLPSIIWLSPHPMWTSVDYIECIIHETIHLALFNGDMIYGIYKNPRGLQLIEDAKVVSAIRRVKRPIDKSYHSACVAVGIAYFHHLLGRDALVKDMMRNLRVCVEDINKKTKYLGAYGNAILATLTEFVSSRSFERVNSAFNDPALAFFKNPEVLRLPSRRAVSVG